MKTDPISILVYIILGIILYYCIGIIVKVLYLYLSLPPFSYFQMYTFGTNNPIMIIPNILWSIIYSTQLLLFVTVVFVIIMVVLFILYIIWLILQKIPIFGPIILSAVPPFRQFEEAGIFQLISDVLETISTWLPRSIVKMFGRLFLVIVKFTKDKIIDIAKAIKPDLELQTSDIDVVLNKMEKFENQEIKSLHKADTLEYINEGNLAEKYKSLTSITPELSEIDRMSIAFNNEVKKMDIQFQNIKKNIKIEMATLPT